MTSLNNVWHGTDILHMYKLTQYCQLTLKLCKQHIILCNKQLITVLSKLTSHYMSEDIYSVALRKKATIHQVTTMRPTSLNALFPGHNHMLTTGTDDLTLWLSPKCQRVKGHQYR